jgi:hypothetical protein
MRKLARSQCWFGDTYQAGDIVRVVPKGWDVLEAKASELVFTPHIKWLHHFIVGPFCDRYENFPIGQSTPKHGVNLRWLSDYDDYTYSVLRLNRPDAAAIGLAAWQALPFEGLRPYGYMSMLGILAGLAGIEYASWKSTRRLKSVTAHDMAPYMSDEGLLCTQLVPDLYSEAGLDILLPGDAALPCAFEAALRAGILVDVTQLI